MTHRFALALGLTAALAVAGLVTLETALADNSLGSPTTARSRHPNQEAVARTRLGTGQVATYGTATDIEVISTTDDGATRPLRIPQHAIVDFECTATGGWVCFSMTPNSDDINIAATGGITDANGADGAGTCFFCSGKASQVFEFSHFRNATLSVMRRTGECRDDSPADGATGRPCRVAADCAGSYTCNTADDWLAGGAIQYGYIISPAATNPINGVMLDVQGI